MDEKKAIKISLSTFFLILAIIVIIVMCIFMFKLYNEKTEETKKSSELQTQVNNLNETISDLQGKIDNISETINSNNSTENTSTANNSTSFTDEQVKTALSNYLELRAHADCGSPLEYLNEKGKLNYDSSQDTILNDGTIITSIKFSDYKNAMLNYVSENEFEKNWTSTQYLNENNNGYLTKGQGGGKFWVYTVNSITKTNNSTYSTKITATDDFEDSKKDENLTFTVKSYNGNCVIDSIK